MTIARLPRALAPVAALLWALAAAPPALARDLPAWFTVTPPGGWSQLDRRAEDIAGNLRMESQLDTSAFRADASMWASVAPPATADAAFLVTWIRTTEPVTEAQAVVAVRAQLDRMRAIPDQASLSPGHTAVDDWQKSSHGGVVHAQLSWRHLDNQTQSVVRTVILQTSGGELRQVSAECLRGLGGKEEPWQRCLRALDSLTIALPEARRQPLVAAVSPDGDAPGAALGPAGLAGPDTPLVLNNASPLGGKDVPPIAVARPEQSGYRVWLYLLGALLVLIGVYIPVRSHVRSRNKAEDDE